MGYWFWQKVELSNHCWYDSKGFHLLESLWLSLSTQNNMCELFYVSKSVCVYVTERIQVLLASSEGDCWSHPSNRLSSGWSLMDPLNQSRSLSVAVQQNEKSGNWSHSQGWESYKGDKVIKTSSCPACWLVLSDLNLLASHDRSRTSIWTKLVFQQQYFSSTFVKSKPANLASLSEDVLTIL